MILASDSEGYRMIAVFVVAVLFAIPGIILFDQIIRFMYEHRRDIWEAEERPRGLLYTPPGARHWHTFAREYAMNWTFSTPNWMRSEPYCLRKLRIIRWLEVAAIVVALAVWFMPII